MANSPISARTVTIIIVALCLLFAGGAYSIGVMNMKAESKAEPEEAKHDHDHDHKAAAAPSLDVSLLEIKPYDVVYGDSKAPVTIVEYASLSCSHCADFHTKQLPELRKNYLDTGKAKLVLRQFPLNAPALKGAQLVSCAGTDEQIKFIKVLFEMQSDWAFNEKYMESLKQIAAVGGISGEKFDACMNDKAFEDALIAKSQEASEKLGIQGTPAFFLGDKPYTGELTSAALGEAIDALKTK